jgi:hypothetical protein
VEVLGTRKFRREYVEHPDDVVAITKKYVTSPAAHLTSAIERGSNEKANM